MFAANNYLLIEPEGTGSNQEIPMALVKKTLKAWLTPILILFAQATPALAQTTHYVAPRGASITCAGNLGDATCPFSSVNAALTSGLVEGGNTLLLMDGVHDRIVITGRSFSTPVAIQSRNLHQAAVETIHMDNTSGFTFRNLKVYATPDIPFPLARFNADTSYISLDGMLMQSTANVDDVLLWNYDEWRARRRFGVWLYGSNSKMINSTVKAVKSGIWSNGRNNQVINNQITELTGDGLRGGSDTVISGNYVANFMLVDDDHLDGFQAIGTISGLVLSENRIFEWTHADGHPLQASIQGIGMFDGFYDDFLIQNNIVSVSAYHGIAVYGGRGGRIVNNTVIHRSGNSEKFPWIGIFNHKNGTPSNNIVVANNLAMAFSGNSYTNNVVLTDNSVVLYPDTVFQDVAGFDYRLKADSPLIDSANPLYAPSIDIDGHARPFGAGPDMGAFEFWDSSKHPIKTDTSQETQLDPEPAPIEEEIADSVPDTEYEPYESTDEAAPDDDLLIEENTKPVRLRSRWTDGALPGGSNSKRLLSTSEDAQDDDLLIEENTTSVRLWNGWTGRALRSTSN